jgi:hypothetical protein
MILLGLLSFVPYLLLMNAARDQIQMPPTGVLLATGASCLLYHLLFLHACKRLGYSFLTITYFFFWIFMGLAPLMCSLTGRWLWGNISDEMASQIVSACALSVLFMGVFHAIHALTYKRGYLSRFLTRSGVVSDGRLFLGLWFSLSMSIIVLVGLGVSGTFYRTGYDSYVASGISALFIQNFVRPMPLLIGVPMLWVLMKERLALVSFRTWLALITIGMAVVINFPLSVARFYGWTVISVFFYYFILHRRLVRISWLAGAFLMAGFFGSFVADAARYATSTSDLQQSFTSAQIINTDSFYVGHVDAFEMLVYGVQFVREQGTTMGRQALGVVAFWMPRSIWPDKPQTTGVLMGSSFINLMTQTANTNLSAPLVLEGYINFGVIGVLLFAALAGGLGGTLDRALFERRAMHLVDANMVYGIDAIASPLMGLWVYLLRGSLLSAFAYSTGIVFASIMVWRFFFRRLK